MPNTYLYDCAYNGIVISYAVTFIQLCILSMYNIAVTLLHQFILVVTCYIVTATYNIDNIITVEVQCFCCVQQGFCAFHLHSTSIAMTSAIFSC